MNYHQFKAIKEENDIIYVMKAELSKISMEILFILDNVETYKTARKY